MGLETVRLTPDAGQLILALANKSGMNPTTAFRELIDNSLDAGATAVLIRYSRRRGRLEVIDNGRGTDDIEDIATPFKHKKHQTTESGRYGIGGTASLIFLCGGQGAVEVESITGRFVSRLVADFAEMARTDLFDAGRAPTVPNEGQPTGTTIFLSGCRELNHGHVGSAYRELAFTFSPALRKGVEIAFDVDGKRTAWEPPSTPARVARLKLDGEVEGHRIRGFCDLVKSGEPNFVKGWAVGRAHRFIGKFGDPARGRGIDLARIYSEVMLPRSYTNINDHKDDFIQYPSALWEWLAEACAPILDRAEEEGQSIQLEAATRNARDLLNLAVGLSDAGIKGRRPNKPGKPAPDPPEKEGSPHRQFSEVQPGDKPSAGNRDMPRRIDLCWTSDLGPPYEIRPQGHGVMVMINKDCPGNLKYQAQDAGPFLADIVLSWIVADMAIRAERYRSLLGEFIADDVPRRFDELRARIYKPENSAA